MAAFAKAIERITKSIRVSSEELEHFLDDPIIEDYYKNMLVVKNDLDSVLYAIEQSLDDATNESYH